MNIAMIARDLLYSFGAIFVRLHLLLSVPQRGPRLEMCGALGLAEDETIQTTLTFEGPG